MVVPLREELEWTDIRLGRVTGADPGVNELYVRDARTSRDETLRYDQLVVALGSVSRVLPVPGLAEHGAWLQDPGGRDRAAQPRAPNLEIAESLPDDEARREYLTFVFVGAGYAGVEGFAELQDYVADMIDHYPRCRHRRHALDPRRGSGPDHARDPGEPRRVRRARAAAARHGDPHGHDARSMDERTRSRCPPASASIRTSCWTAGVRRRRVVKQLGLPLGPGGRIETDATMRVRATTTSGRSATPRRCPIPPSGARRPPRRPASTRSGRDGVVAEQRRRRAGGKKPQPFRYRTLGVFVDLGRNKAVATVLGVRLRGFPAWFAARTYHLYMMPGMARRVRLGIDWAVGLVFGRASAELGQLGHPPSLGDYLDDVTRAGETPGR